MSYYCIFVFIPGRFVYSRVGGREGWLVGTWKMRGGVEMMRVGMGSWLGGVEMIYAFFNLHGCFENLIPA